MVTLSATNQAPTTRLTADSRLANCRFFQQMNLAADSSPQSAVWDRAFSLLPLADRVLFHNSLVALSGESFRVQPLPLQEWAIPEDFFGTLAANHVLYRDVEFALPELLFTKTFESALEDTAEPLDLSIHPQANVFGRAEIAEMFDDDPLNDSQSESSISATGSAMAAAVDTYCELDQARQRHTPVVGDLLGRCLLTEVIGRGGAGLVFRALHKKLNISVAVKVLLPDEDCEGPMSEQLAREARLMAQISHPNVVRVFDFEDEGHCPYIVMEFVEGLNFSQLTEQSGRVQPDQAIDLISQAANGLAEGARRGIIHRDVKPANLLLSREGVVKVADLGLGKMLASRNSNSKDTIVGTALYMSPEQCMGRLDLDHRTDIYALGVTLYQMVTGVTPFTGRSTAEVLLKHASHTPIAPREVVKTLSPALNDLIMEMLAKKPEDRPQNYEILLQRLQECRTGKAKANANGDSLTESSLQSSASRSKARWFGLFGRK